MKFKIKKDQGFTLIELLVVISIIGLLATMAVTSLNNARSKSRDAKRVADIKNIRTALELYYADSSGYPATPAGADPLGDEAAANCISTCDAQCLDEDGFVASCDTGGTTYMGQVPANPSPNGIPYAYAQTNGGTDYTLDFDTENTIGQLDGTDCQATSYGITCI